ncbi:hypothetical protein FOA52_001530 [Chlamydomonas sp. UWO 241]|nr:hypothetical protein FOA52_001530 [Chlamydomonas sp. UWO 241]
MALVPFRTLGPAADQSVSERLFIVGGLALKLRQQPRVGLRPTDPRGGGGGASLVAVELEAQQGLGPSGGRGTGAGAGDAAGQLRPAGSDAHGEPPPPPAPPPAPAPAAVGPPRPGEHLGDVGLVAWQCGFVLADLMLRAPPLGSWAGVRVVDLGTGTGLVGVAMCVAGARVVLTDMPHVLPFAVANSDANCEAHGVAAAARPAAVAHAWGDAGSAALLLLPHGGGRPDVITAADVLYEPAHHAALLDTLDALCAPHTLVFIAWKKRSAAEGVFVGLAEARGYTVEAVPVEQLAEEYRDGAYAVLRLVRLDAMDTDSGGGAGDNGGAGGDDAGAGGDVGGGELDGGTTRGDGVHARDATDGGSES